MVGLREAPKVKGRALVFTFGALLSYQLHRNLYCGLGRHEGTSLVQKHCIYVKPCSAAA